MLSLSILVAPSGLKESVEPLEAVKYISAGIRKVFPKATIYGIPIVDGGEGTTKTLVKLTKGTLVEATVTGPVGEQVNSYIGILGGKGPKTAVIEIALAAGLRLVPPNKRNPQLTTTYGVGELIKLALDNEVEKILLGCGDSGTNDGGIGMAQALGIILKDKNGKKLGHGGIELSKLNSIDMSKLDPRLKKVQIDVALNANNILTGPNGVARVYGPQKGANLNQVEEMAQAFDNFAKVIQKDLDIDVALIKGGGASGGLGAGLRAFLGANLYPRFDLVLQYLGLEDVLSKVDLIVTAEGTIDYQTPKGKVPALLANIAKKYDIPVIVLAGIIGEGARDNYPVGISAFESIMDGPTSLENAIKNGSSLLEAASERLMRILKVGIQLK